MKEEQKGPKDIIYRKNDLDDKIYFIHKGQVEFFYENSKNE
jgi:CRP-like cAMP-binding protein